MNLIKFWHCGAAKAMAPALLDCIGNPLTTSWEDCHALSKWMVSVHHHTGVPGFPVWWALNKSRGQIVNISPFIEDSYAGAAATLCKLPVCYYSSSYVCNTREVLAIGHICNASEAIILEQLHFIRSITNRAAVATLEWQKVSATEGQQCLDSSNAWTAAMLGQ